MAIEQLEKLVIHKAERGDVFRLECMIAAMGTGKDYGYFEHQFDRVESGMREIYIAVLDGVDTGYCILNWFPKYALFQKLEIPEVQDLNVLPNFRRCGIATMLIEHCENLARARGKDQIGIGVSVAAQAGPAQRLYGKLGYVADGNGVTYDRKLTAPNEVRPLDDQLCLMMVKTMI
ncbi:MAG: GNAT family N-acetyltransferase [Alphaproteobacteria bacterium]|nr:GNAT family N-acetyltransferase [Alphaproteobacteria bacterium]